MTQSALKKFVRPALFGTALLAAVSLQANDQDQAQPPQQASSSSEASASKASSEAVKFIKDAARDNQAEVGMAELGVRKAQNDKLRDFCKQLQKDHMLAGEQLRPIASKYGVPVEQSLAHKEEKHMAKLEKATGTEFDKEFATQMLKDHEKDIQKFERASQKLQESDVKQFAENMLPKLQQHFQMAAEVAQTVGVSQSTISSFSKHLPQNVGGSADTQNTTTGSGSSSGRMEDQSTGGAGARDQIQGSQSSGQSPK